MKKFKVTISTREQHYFLNIIAESSVKAMQAALNMFSGEMGMLYISARCA